MSFQIILPFLKPIEAYILDENVSEVMVNPSGRIFVESGGVIDEVRNVKLNPNHLEVAVKSIARLLGDDVSEEKPILDARLPDGSRVAAVYMPCSVGGITLTIRKFHARWFSLEQLVKAGSIDKLAASILDDALQSRKNILISGGTGTGKTTLLNALASRIPDHERIVVIEDTLELQLSKSNVVRWEAHGQRGNISAVTIRDLVKASLRHRPDRLLVGEVRGAEAFDLLQALNTGHSGSLSTIHANSPTHALTRLSNCVLESKIDLPYEAIRANIASSLDIVVQVQRRNRVRVVTEIVRIGRYDHTSDQFDSTPLFQLNDESGV